MVSEKIGTEQVVREPGLLYFLGKDGKVWQVPMKHNKTGEKKAITTEVISKKPGKMYYLGKDGFVYEAALKNVKV